VLALNLAAIFAWPWLGPPAREALGPFYQGLCHRRPERCWWVGGEPMPACARCVGVWLGLAVMATAAALAGVLSLRVGAALLGCMLLSWSLGRWLPEGWHLERTVAGVAGGVGLYVVAARGGAWLGRRLRRVWR
jgi:hypothetical protein